MPRGNSSDARRRKAQALRSRIADILSGESSPTKGSSTPSRGESPREFVHRRMRELAEQKKAGARAKSRARASGARRRRTDP
jgi:hypothetical protein